MLKISVEEDSQRICIPIELKAVESKEDNIIQIQRYIDWIEQYYISNRQSDIQPILISKKIENKATESYKQIIKSFKKFNQINLDRCNKLKFVEFKIQENDLIFEEVKY